MNAFDWDLEHTKRQSPDLLIFRMRTNRGHEKTLKMHALECGRIARAMRSAHSAAEKHQTILKVARELFSGACVNLIRCAYGRLD
ncbi:MAG: hypothetical protein WAM90_00705 [Rhodanobacter sp.]